MKLASIALLTLVLAACGGGDGSASAGSASDPGAGSTSTPGTPSSGSSATGNQTSSGGSGSTGAGSSGSGSSGSGSSTGTGSGGSGTPSTPPVTPTAKSTKRGVAYDLADPADFAALSPGVTWWYNWGSTPNAMVPADYIAQYGMDYYPMLWNGTFDSAKIVAFLQANPSIKYLLVMNEPNLTSQSNITPQQAATIWPTYEAVAKQAGVKIVGPQITYGTMPNYTDPVQWMDAFIAAYQAANSGRSPEIDCLGFHWYDYGIDTQLDRMDKYASCIWVTEFANWHTSNDSADIDSLAKQEAQMQSMVGILESRADVARYAWFSGRVTNDVHFSSLLGASGQLTDLGKLYLSLPANNAQ